MLDAIKINIQRRKQVIKHVNMMILKSIVIELQIKLSFYIFFIKIVFSDNFILSENIIITKTY